MMDLRPITRWLVAFLTIGLLASVAFALIGLLLIPLGFPLPLVIGGAVGCGVGTGLVNATFIALG